MFSEDRLLRVNGTLIAEGTEQDSITITGFNWKFIEITNNLGGSIIAYADITDESENEWGDWKVKLNRASSLSNSTIHNVPNGVAVGDSSSKTITHSTIFHKLFLIYILDLLMEIQYMVLVVIMEIMLQLDCMELPTLEITGFMT